MTHTPTPWRVAECPEDIIGADDAAVATTDTSVISMISPEDVRAANAAFIVRAVNSHDKLVEALRYADTRAVSRAAYPHACLEDKKLRDLIDAALEGLE